MRLNQTKGQGLWWKEARFQNLLRGADKVERLFFSVSKGQLKDCFTAGDMSACYLLIIPAKLERLSVITYNCQFTRWPWGEWMNQLKQIELDHNYNVSSSQHK